MTWKQAPMSGTVALGDIIESSWVPRTAVGGSHLPVSNPSCRYDFVPPVKYNYLKEEEAEERFERRNKTLNYFSIMLSKKLKDGEEGEGGGMLETGEGSSGVKSKKKTMDADLGLVRYLPPPF